jgi:hypothetical protein
MSRRLEIELTSERPDGTWTWRAAGAKQPKGELDAAVLPESAKVGDVLRADADFAVEGIEILAVLPPKGARKEPERLVVVGTRSDDEPLVTTQLAPKGRGGGRRDRGDWEDRGDRGDRRGGPRGDRGRDGGRDAGRDGDRRSRPGGERPRGPRPDPVPERPRPKRLRPGRTHRSAVIDELAVEERPIAEQVLRGGVPAVREAIAKQNEQARAENRPEIPSEQLVALAERLLPKLRAAEWRDKADAALADLDELDLRDLRSVVVAADGNARDEEARALLAQIQEGLARRVEEEHTNWIDDMTANLDAGRFVRTLRLSSRPPKAGTPLPPELATRLIAAVSEGLTPTVNQDLWAAAVDALAFSPVRNKVTPAGRPEEPSAALLEVVTRMGDRLPQMVELFGIDPAEVAKAAKRRTRGGRGAPKGAPKAGGAKGGPAKERPAAPAEADAPPAEADAEAAAADTAPVEAETAPLDVEVTPVETETAPSEVAASPMEADAEVVEAEATAVDAETDAAPAEEAATESTPPETEEASAEAAPVEADAAPVEVDAAPAEAAAPPEETEELTVDDAPVEAPADVDDASPAS